jgi:hypothetical protein
MKILGFLSLFGQSIDVDACFEVKECYGNGFGSLDFGRL